MTSAWYEKKKLIKNSTKNANGLPLARLCVAKSRSPPPEWGAATVGEKGGQSWSTLFWYRSVENIPRWVLCLPFERYSPNKKLHQKNESQKECQFAPTKWKHFERKDPMSENRRLQFVALRPRHIRILSDLNTRMAKEAVSRNPVCKSLNQQERQSNTGTSACKKMVPK